MAVGQNQSCHFGVGAPPILVYFSRDWDVHWGYDLDFGPRPCLYLSFVGSKGNLSLQIRSFVPG